MAGKGKQDRERGPKGSSEETSGASTAMKRPLRPSQCREYMRKTLTREFPEIVEGFVKGAKRGSCQHVKLATELLEARPKAARVRTSGGTVRKLIKQMERIQD